MIRKLIQGVTVAVVMGFGLTTLAQELTETKHWDLRKFDQPGQITIFDGPAYVSTTGKPVEVGDYNGNGCGDVAITGQNARNGAGQVRIVWDLCEHWGTTIDVLSPAEDRVALTTIWGAQAGDMFGTEVFAADFNADGFDDLLVGAQNANLPDRSRAGAAYLIFGRDHLHETATLDLAQLPAVVLTVYGADSIDRLGIWVSGGDFDGDGYADMLLGANQADGPENRRANAGEAVVLYGADDMLAEYGAVIDLRSPPAAMTWIIGADYDDLLGSSVYGGAVNRDGVDDILVSAALWRGSAGVGGLSFGAGDGPANTRYNSGETYIIYGHRDLRGQTLDLQQLIDLAGVPTSDRLTVIYGPEPNDIMGEEIVVGDLNGDGWNEVVVGSLATPGRDNRRPDSGEAWVVYGGADLPGRAIDLAVPGAGVPIYAAASDSKGGDTLLIRDIDQDGFGDLLYGAPNADVVDEQGRARVNAGLLVVIYGMADGLATTDGVIDLAEPPSVLRLGFLMGADAHDMSAYAMSSLDIDADGFPDLVLNGMNGDGPDNRRTDAGEIYVVSGRAFTALQTNEVVSVPDSTASPAPTAFPTNTPLTAQEPATVQPGITPVPLQQGRLLYELNCAGCHGIQGEGIHGIGVPLAGSDYLDRNQFNDAEVIAFIRQGRSADAPGSQIGRAMPPSGGNPGLTDAELAGIIAYVRTLPGD